MSKPWSNTSSIPTDLAILVADGRLRPDEAEMLRTVTRQFRLRRAMLSLMVMVASIAGGVMTLSLV
jgi:hypothetical protein